MRGHVRKRGNTWSIVYDEGRDESGRRVQKWSGGHATKRAAQAELTKVLGSLADGDYVTPDRLTVRQFVEETWLPVARTRYRATTIDTYERALRKHVLPRIGAVRLQKLAPTHLDKLYRELGAAGLAPSTVRLVAAIVSSSLKHAKRKRLVPVNVATLADVPSAPKKRMRVWTPEQLRTFLEHVADERLAALWRFMALTGVRRGEALGLTWFALDLDAGTCRIDRQLVPVGGKAFSCHRRQPAVNGR